MKQWRWFCSSRVCGDDGEGKRGRAGRGLWGGHFLGTDQGCCTVASVAWGSWQALVLAVGVQKMEMVPPSHGPGKSCSRSPEAVTILWSLPHPFLFTLFPYYFSSKFVILYLFDYLLTFSFSLIRTFACEGRVLSLCLSLYTWYLA